MSKKSFVPVDYSSSSSPSELVETILPLPRRVNPYFNNPQPDYSAVELIAMINKNLDEVQLPTQEPLKKTQSFKIPSQSHSGCTCKKTKCLKMYCQCFASGNHCKPGCSCYDCSNNETGEQQRVNSILSILQRDPFAFSSRQTKQNSQNVKGCNCRKSGCQKKYCDCYTSGVGCTSACRCWGCQNHKPVKQLKMKKFLSMPQHTQSKVCQQL